jgi:hypothetical protein
LLPEINSGNNTKNNDVKELGAAGNSLETHRVALDPSISVLNSSTVKKGAESAVHRNNNLSKSIDKVSGNSKKGLMVKSPSKKGLGIKDRLGLHNHSELKPLFSSRQDDVIKEMAESLPS